MPEEAAELRTRVATLTVELDAKKAEVEDLKRALAQADTLVRHTRCGYTRRPGWSCLKNIW